MVYPDENVFDIQFVSDIFEQLTLTTNEMIDIGWVINTMRKIGVPFMKLFNAYNEMFESKVQPWNSPKHIPILLSRICFLLNVWIDTAKKGEEFIFIILVYHSH